MDGLQGYFSRICKRLHQHCFSRLLQGGTSSPEKALQKQLPEMFHKKVILRNFTKFTGKHLRQSLFFNKVAGLVKLC